MTERFSDDELDAIERGFAPSVISNLVGSYRELRNASSAGLSEEGALKLIADYRFGVAGYEAHMRAHWMASAESWDARLNEICDQREQAHAALLKALLRQ